MGLLAAYAVPHPPLIVPAVGGGQEAEISRTTDAFREVARRIAAHDPDVVVITSPHAPLYRDGFFIADTPEEAGSLAQFGQPRERIAVHTDLPFARAVSERLERRSIPTAGAPAGHGDIDHAAFVPLHFLAETLDLDEIDVVRIGLSGLSPSDHHFLGQSITRAAERLGRRAVLIASGDMSHKLKEDGPYGFNPAGPKFDRAVADIFNRGALQELFALDPMMCEDAAECGLRSFEIMAGALEGLPFTAELLSYEGPFGVGYGVAAFEVEAGPSTTEQEVEAEVRGAHARKAAEKTELAETGEAAAENGKGPSGSRAGEEEAADPQAPPSHDAETRRGTEGRAEAAEPLDAEDEAEPGSCLEADPAVDPIVALARLAVESYVGCGIVLPVPEGLPAELTEQRAGAFVSLHERGGLRGCIGTIAPMRDNLAEEIIMNGIAAASEDPRFPPVRPEELDVLSYSVDVLGEPEPVGNLSQLDPKRYGVIVTRGFRRGLLLPDLEGVDTVMDQISIAKQKAGIAPEEDVKLERFEVVRHTRGGEARYD